MVAILLVNGNEVGFWQSLSSKDTITSICDTFTVGSPNVKNQNDMYLPISPGDRIEILDDDGGDSTGLFSGYCDDLSISVSASNNTISAVGRSDALDLVDCSHEIPGGKMVNVDALQIANRISEPYGTVFEVADGVAIGEVYDVFKLKPGETCFMAINRALRNRALLPSNVPFSNVIQLVKPRSMVADDMLEVGVNCYLASGTMSMRQRFSHTKIISQAPAPKVKGKRKRDPGASNKLSAVVIDGEVERYRLKVMIPPDVKTAEQALNYAKWQASYNAGSSSSVNVTVTGWRQSSGKYWASNMDVQLTANPLNAYDRTMLIKSASFQYAEGVGKTTLLELVHPDTFSFPEEEEITKKREPSIWKKPVYISSIGRQDAGEIIDKKVR